MRVVSSLVLFLLAGAALAIEPFSCRNGGFPRYTDFSLAEIVAGPEEQVHFRSDDRDCPTNEKCVQRAYLINGDSVIVAHPQEGWACVWYFGETRDFVGWMPESNLKTVASPDTRRLEDWVGTWEDVGSTTLKIEPAPDQALKVSGNARWNGANGIVHYGSVDATASPTGDQLTVDDSVCVVNITAVGPYLIATDNNLCGGLNVSFTSVYRRRP